MCQLSFDVTILVAQLTHGFPSGICQKTDSYKGMHGLVTTVSSASKKQSGHSKLTINATRLDIIYQFDVYFVHLKKK